MILAAAKAKAAAYALPIIGTLLVTAALAFWWLWSDRESLLEENSNLNQAMDQAKATNQQNQSEISRLNADIQGRDRQAVIRSEREQTLNDQLAATERELKELVKDAPCSGPEYLWPDAVYKRMRSGTVADPNRDQEGPGAGSVPDTANTPGPSPED